MRKRPKNLIAKGWVAMAAAARGRTEHAPTTVYPDHVLRRTSFLAGGGHGWRISALETPRAKPAPWKIVVVTGAPSWAEYWAETMAALPSHREMVVVDRPGYAGSEPRHPVLDIRVQAEALAPVLKAARGQKVLLVGQSYGAAIAAIMAARNPRKVAGLVLLSGFFGEPGPTARMLLALGGRALKLIPSDLRHAVIEARNQKPQLAHARRALGKVRAPIHMIHGEADDFAPLEAAERLAAELVTRRPIRIVRTPGANHFLNDGPAEAMVAALETCLPRPRRFWRFPMPRLTELLRLRRPALAN